MYIPGPCLSAKLIFNPELQEFNVFEITPLLMYVLEVVKLIVQGSVVPRI